MGKEKIMAKVIEIAEKRDALELSKDEVTLAIPKDLQKAISMLNKAESKLRKSAAKADSDKEKYNDTIEKAADTADAAWDKGKSDWDATDDVRPKAIAIFNKIESSAKELGVDITQVDGYNKASDSLKSFDNAVDLISDSLQELQRAIK